MCAQQQQKTVCFLRMYAACGLCLWSGGGFVNVFKWVLGLNTFLLIVLQHCYSQSWTFSFSPFCFLTNRSIKYIYFFNIYRVQGDSLQIFTLQILRQDHVLTPCLCKSNFCLTTVRCKNKKPENLHFELINCAETNFLLFSIFSWDWTNSI